MVLAWTTAVLGRADKIPPLENIVGRGHRTPAEAAAEMRAQMRAYRAAAAKQGKIRSWSEWLH